MPIDICRYMEMIFSGPMNNAVALGAWLEDRERGQTS
jgi:hypothetical protein